MKNLKDGFGEHFFTGQCHSWKFYICSRNAPLHTARHILSYNPAVKIARWKWVQFEQKFQNTSSSIRHSSGNELSKRHASERELYNPMACIVCVKLQIIAHWTADIESQTCANLTLRKANSSLFAISHSRTVVWRIFKILTFIRIDKKRHRHGNVHVR